MSPFGEMRQVGRRGVVTAGVVVLLLVATVGGAAWALGVSKGKRFELATTYYVDLAPTQSQSQERTVFWTVGQATVEASCAAGYDDPANPGKISMGWGGGVHNNGPGPIGVIGTHPESADAVTWLAAGEGIDAGPGPGQSVNETNYPGPVGGIQTIAIVDENGTSASGTWAYSARVNESDQTAHCVFTLQMRG